MKKNTTLDRDDVDSLLKHIEGHVSFGRDALDAGDIAGLKQQAVEIEGWAQAIIEATDKAGSLAASPRGEDPVQGAEAPPPSDRRPRAPAREAPRRR